MINSPKYLSNEAVNWQFDFTLDHLNLNIDVGMYGLFFFVSTIWEIWIFYVYKHKKRRLFLVLWLRIWFIVWFKSIFTPAATLWIFEKILSWNYFRRKSIDILKLKPAVIWGQSNLKIYKWDWEIFRIIWNNSLSFIELLLLHLKSLSFNKEIYRRKEEN